MRALIVSCFVLTACTKQNPQACCTDEADCATVGLPVGTTCDQDHLCRGNRCVEQLCGSAAECDVTAPYCVMTDEGRCSEACTADAQCPGFGQTAERFCIDGSCAECRVGMNDCPTDRPLCSNGACVACVAHSDCASGVCANGACASEDEIAYVSTTGSPASDCTKVSPCNTIERGLLVGPARTYILIDGGTYTSTAGVTLSGTRTLIGRSATRPVITRSTDGPIFLTTGTGSVDVKLEHLELFGARGSTTGNGFECAQSAGTPKVELFDVVSRMNAFAGFVGRNCTFKATASTFTENVGIGVQLTDGSAQIDRCTFTANNSGMDLDSGIYVVTNSVVARNNYFGVSIYATAAGNRVEFNTIIDNNLGGAPDARGTGVFCNFDQTVASFASNIIARNRVAQTAGMNCVYPSSIIISDNDISSLKLKSPDAAPFDYHIQTGSIAIDAGTISTLKTDLDGEARPAGAGNDVGADELH